MKKKPAARPASKAKPAAGKPQSGKKSPALKKVSHSGKTVPARKPKRAEAAAPARAKASKKSPSTQASGRLQSLRGTLLAKREWIVREAKNEIAKYISGETRQLVDTAIDEGDWAVVDISEDISLRRLSAHRKLLLDIDEALRKISEGSYGICEECGEEISEKRLSVLPTATLCVDCKENREKLEAVGESEEL